MFQRWIGEKGEMTNTHKIVIKVWVGDWEQTHSHHLFHYWQKCFKWDCDHCKTVWLYKKNLWCIYFKWMNCMVCVSCLNKTVFKNIATWKDWQGKNPKQSPGRDPSDASHQNLLLCAVLSFSLDLLQYVNSTITCYII